eukprot:6485570-Amphidinium_carterae.1
MVAIGESLTGQTSIILAFNGSETVITEAQDRFKCLPSQVQCLWISKENVKSFEERRLSKQVAERDKQVAERDKQVAKLYVVIIVLVIIVIALLLIALWDKARKWAGKFPSGLGDDM